jgi:hypothetical protein
MSRVPDVGSAHALTKTAHQQQSAAVDSCGDKVVTTLFRIRRKKSARCVKRRCTKLPLG